MAGNNAKSGAGVMKTQSDVDEGLVLLEIAPGYRERLTESSLTKNPKAKSTNVKTKAERNWIWPCVAALAGLAIVFLFAFIVLPRFQPHP